MEKFSQPQRILVCLQGLENEFYNEKEILESAEALSNKTDPTATEKSFCESVNEAVKAVRNISKFTEVLFLTYKNKELKNALELLPEEQFTQIALDKNNFFKGTETKPGNDNVQTLKNELDKRWKSDAQIDGHLFFVTDNSDAIKPNSKHVTMIKRENSDESDLKWSVSFAAVNALYATQPSRPYSTLKVPGISSKLVSTLAKRNEILKSKVSTYKTNISGEVFIDRLVTTSEDSEYRSLEVKQTLSAVRYDLRRYFETRFKRYMLVKDKHPYSGPVLSPKSIKALLVSRYRMYQSQNLLQDDGEVAKNIKVEVSKKNSSKVDIYFPVVTMGQLLITQTQIAFRT